MAGENPKPCFMNVKETRTRELRIQVPRAPKPCPYCPSTGDALELRDEEMTARVFCRGCGAYGPFGRTVTQAIDAWNHENPVGWDERLSAVEGRGDKPPREEKKTE